MPYPTYSPWLPWLLWLVAVELTGVACWLCFCGVSWLLDRRRDLARPVAVSPLPLPLVAATDAALRAERNATLRLHLSRGDLRAVVARQRATRGVEA